jgi:acyl carrier protein
MLAELRPGSEARAISLDADLERDLGLDSLSRVELATRLERAFGVRLPDDVATGASTLRELSEAIARATTSSHRDFPAPVAVEAPPEPIQGLPDDASTLVEAFAWHVERHGAREHVTLIEGDDVREVLTYAALWTRAAGIADGLRARDIGSGDAVALMLPTGSAFFETFLGTLLAGAVPVPLYPPVRVSDIEAHVRGRAAILANAQARVLVTVPEAMLVSEALRGQVPALRDVVTADRLRGQAAATTLPVVSVHDLALLQYTSGSTGSPKGVMLRHDNLLANIRAMGHAAAVTSVDRFLSWLPLYHDMGLIGAWLATMYHGVPLVIMPPTSFLARPSRWLRAIHRFRATISAGPNFAYEIAATKIPDGEIEGIDLSTWRLAFNGAEPVRAASLEKFARRFEHYGFDRRALTPVYGLAECAVGLTFPPLARGPRVARVDEHALANEGLARPATDGASALEVVSCGVPLAGHEVRVVDDIGRELPERSEGRIEFRGPSATPGYLRNPQSTAALFRGGWLDSGDVGFVDGGELYVTSRIKDLIKRGGHNIHPYDLEAAIGDIPGIRKGCVAVFGVPDRMTGTERVVVVAETNQKDDALRATLRERIQAQASIHLDGPADEVLLVSARTVLKTSSGKIRRSACRELYESGSLGARPRAVWVQLAGLAARAAASSLRRVVRAFVAVAYGAYAWAATAVFAGVAVVGLCVIPRADARYRFAHRAAQWLLRILRIRLDVAGAEHLPGASPAILVANHASYVDAMVLLAAVPAPVRFVAKRELARVRAMAYVLRRLGTLFVERDDAARGIEDTRELCTAVRSGASLVVFPEGTFTRAPGLRPFRLGAFSVSAETAVPVVPVVLRGTRSLLREHRWLPSRRPLNVEVAPPMMPAGHDWSCAIGLRTKAREAILERLQEYDLA